MSHEVNIICCPDGLLRVGKQPPLLKAPSKTSSCSNAGSRGFPAPRCSCAPGCSWTDACRALLSHLRSCGAQLDEQSYVPLVPQHTDLHRLRLPQFQPWDKPNQSLRWRPQTYSHGKRGAEHVEPQGKVKEMCRDFG